MSAQYLMKCLWKGVADTDQQQDAADRIEELEAQVSQADDVLNVANVFCKELEAKLEAMTLQHEAALEAVGKAREAALDAASEYMATQYGISAISHPVDRGRILALINKGDSRE